MADEASAVSSAITSRLSELGWTQQELARRSQVSVATIRQLQNDPVGRRRNPRTLMAVSEALGWTAGHLAALAEGRDPETGSATKDSLDAQLSTIRESMAAMNSRIEAIERRLDEGQGSERARDSGP